MKPLTNAAAALLLSSATLCMPLMAADHSHHHGHSQEQKTVQIDHPWSRPTPPGTPMGVGYMVITNNGEQDITLVSAESPRAGHVSIHETYEHEGLMRMQRVSGGLTIPAGGTVELKPHGYHLMLEQLAEPLTEGELVSVRLGFDALEDVTVELKVQPCMAPR